MRLLDLNPKPTTALHRLDWALNELRRAQVRLTPVREKVLRCLANRDIPAALSDLNADPALAGQFDEATVYRTLVLFVELEVARQIQPHGRAAHFLLNTPGECFSFLICRCCGTITRIEHTPELHEMEHRAAAAHGYAQVSHELELYGVCPRCQKHTETCCKPSKLIPGLRLRGRSVN
jgi:Fe2+ or Zn2+ uptake regulation protein